MDNITNGSQVDINNYYQLGELQQITDYVCSGTKQSVRQKNLQLVNEKIKRIQLRKR